MKSYITSFLLIAFVGISAAQDWQWQRNDELLNPYNIHTKGMNTPFTGDFDDDGDIDLIVGCRGGVLQYYENIGSPDSAIWQTDEDYFSTIELDTSYAPQPSLVDLSGDGMDELYVSLQGYNGGYYDNNLRKFINSGTVENPVWEEEELNFGVDLSGLFNPQFIDYDLDLDIDIVFIHFSDELRLIENIGDSTNPVFQFNDLAFEGFEFEYGNYHNFRLADIYGDDKYEVIGIIGIYDVDESDLRMYVNWGTISEPDWDEGISLYYSSYWTSMTFFDCDNDSDLDIILGNHHIPLYYKENLGTPDSIAVNDSFNGEMRGPFFVSGCENTCLTDYDSDGDFDLIYFYFWGGVEYMYDVGSAVNIGSQYDPDYDFSQEFIGFSPPIYFTSNIFLSPGDLNSDGYPELATHQPQGKYIINNNGNGYNSSNSDTLELDDAEYYMYPELADFDNDGLTDLLIRHRDSLWWRIYKNIGTPEEPAWQWMPDWLSGADRSMGKFRAANINRDDRIDLIGIGYHSYLHGYINTGTGNDVVFEYDPWIFIGWETYLVRYYDCADLDGDGDDDILANKRGVIEFIENRTTVDITDYEQILPSNTSLLQNYPNPFNGSTNISFTLSTAVHVTLTVYDILGRKVETLHQGTLGAGGHTINWTAHQGTPSGIYFYRLKTGDGSVARQMVYVK